jgi:hypothetical protein
MAFKYKSSRNGAQRNLSPAILIKTSEVIAVGDAVETFTSGTGENANAAIPIKGIVHSIVDSDGLPFKKGAQTAGSTNTSDTNSVTGDATQYIKVDTSLNSLYSAEVNGTIGTTTNSDKLGGRIDVDSANTDYGRVLETTNTRTVATTANFYNHGTDPDDSTRLLVSIASSEEYSAPTTET